MPVVTVIDNGDATITASTGNSYSWINCATENIIPDQATQIFTPIVNGSYAALVTINGCSDTSECIDINSVGISEINVNEINLYPNPTKCNVTIKCPF